MREKIFINAEGAIFGRLCSFAAKKALEGSDVIVLNSEKAIVTGNKKNVIGKFSQLRKKGGHSGKGPKYSKDSYKILKRGVRGMLPDHRKGIGKRALARVKCYNGIPNDFKEEKALKINATKKIKFIELKTISERI